MGSNHYVFALSNSQINDISVMLDYDMLASGNYGLIMYDEHGAQGAQNTRVAAWLNRMKLPEGDSSDFHHGRWTCNSQREVRPSRWSDGRLRSQWSREDKVFKRDPRLLVGTMELRVLALIELPPNPVGILCTP